MIHNDQFSYDNATEPSMRDYREEPLFAQFADYVVLELANHRNCMGIDSRIFLIDLEQAGGGYQMALEWVSNRLTERQYLAYKGEYSVEETT